MSEFSITSNQFGDIFVEAGSVVDLSQSTTFYKNIGLESNEAIQNDPTTDAIRRVPRFAGGSGRNIYIYDNILPNVIPYGWFFPVSSQKWVSELGNFFITVNSETAELEFSDETDVICTAPAGSIIINGRSESNIMLTAERGSVGVSEIIYDIGTGTGNTDFYFDAGSGSIVPPAIFKVEWDGVEVINTGYRGTSGTYDGISVVVNGPPTGTASFNKTSASPTWVKVIVDAQFIESAEWRVIMYSPNGGPAPYGTFSNGPFTISSTAYGDSLNGGTPFTQNCFYENGEGVCNALMTSTVLFDGDDTQRPMIQFAYNWQNWSGGGLPLDPYRKFGIYIDETGYSAITDPLGIVAIRNELAALDPTGSYSATTYGKNKYNVGDDFNVYVDLIKLPIGLISYLELEFSGTDLIDVKGPFTTDMLPANTATIKYLPISDGPNQIVTGAVVLR